MIMGGGKWPRRLIMKCQDIYGNFGEEEVYGLWRSTLATRLFTEQLCIGQTKGEHRDEKRTNEILAFARIATLVGLLPPLFYFYCPLPFILKIAQKTNRKALRERMLRAQEAQRVRRRQQRKRRARRRKRRARRRKGKIRARRASSEVLGRRCWFQQRVSFSEFKAALGKAQAQDCAYGLVFEPRRKGRGRVAPSLDFGPGVLQLQ
jgi:hypothetical protein